VFIVYKRFLHLYIVSFDKFIVFIKFYYKVFIVFYCFYTFVLFLLFYFVRNATKPTLHERYIDPTDPILNLPIPHLFSYPSAYLYLPIYPKIDPPDWRNIWCLLPETFIPLPE